MPRELNLQTVPNDEIYGNIHVYSPDGHLMYLCRHKKAFYLLKNGLAKKKSDAPPSIELTFKPKGLGHAGNDFYLTPRKNICVVCAAQKGLTKHHVVPYQYWHFFPEELKRGCSHDVLALCKICHAIAEDQNNVLRDSLADKYSAPINGIGLRVNLTLQRAQRAYNTLKHYLDRIPQARKDDLEDRLQKYFGKEIEDVSQNEIDEMMSAPITTKEEGYKTHGQIVVEKIEDAEAFAAMWRKHFLRTMEPGHLPKGWSVDHRVRHSFEDFKIQFYQYIPVVKLGLEHLISAQDQIPDNDAKVVMSIENKGVLWDEDIHRNHTIAELRGKLMEAQHFNINDRVRFTLTKG